MTPRFSGPPLRGAGGCLTNASRVKLAQNHRVSLVARNELSAKSGTHHCETLCCLVPFVFQRTLEQRTPRSEKPLCLCGFSVSEPALSEAKGWLHCLNALTPQRLNAVTPTSGARP